MTTDIKQGYKQTKIGIIPNDWDIVKISELTKTKSGGTPLTSEKKYWEGGTIPRLPSGKCQNCIIYEADVFITEEGLKNSSAIIFPKDSILIALTGATTGKIGYLTFDSSGNQSITSIRPSNKYISKFLYYYLQKIYQKIVINSIGAAQPHINKAIVDSIDVILPKNIKEQEKIADILSSVDDLIEKTDKVIETQKKLKEGLLSKLMREGIKIKARKLKDIAKFSQGIQVDLEQQKTSPSEGYSRFLRIVDYTQETKDLRYIIFPGERYMADEDDVVMVRYGASAGFIGTGKKGIIANNMFKIEPNGEILKKYLYFFLKQSKVSKLITQMSTASAMPQLNFTMVGSIEITYPEDTGEQQKIIDILISIDEHIKSEEIYKDGLQVLKKGLMDKLLIGEIRVKL